jgi:hypothetical protein
VKQKDRKSWKSKVYLRTMYAYFVVFVIRQVNNGSLRYKRKFAFAISATLNNVIGIILLLALRTY